MKTPIRHLLTLAAVLSGSIATAQESPAGPPPGGNPPREPRAERPAPPPDGAGRRDDDRRPDGPRPLRPDGFNPPDGPAFPGRPRDRQERGDRFTSLIAPLPAKPQPYLGVATSPLDPALSAQLGFTPGLGLIVEEVLPDSPVAKAGLQPLDVIKQLNDQLVSNPAHLAALARHFGKDAEVTLLILRKGQEQKITLKIGERMMRDPAPVRAEIFGGMPGMGRPSFDRRSEDLRRNNDDPNRPPRDPRDGQGAPSQKPSADLFRETGPGGAPEVQTFQDRVSTTWNTASAKVSLKDANGEIEVRSENGKRTLTAKNPKGDVAFDGAIDTEEQRKAIPAEFRKMLEQVEVRSRAERRPDGPPAKANAGGIVRPPTDAEEPKPQRGQPDVQ